MAIRPTQATLLLSALITPALWGCAKTPPPITPVQANSGYVQEINQWHAKRLASLREPGGWLSLVGLFWLKQGDNSLGADPLSDVVIQGPVEHLGVFTLNEEGVWLSVESGHVTENGQPVEAMRLQTDLAGEPTQLDYGTFHFHCIARGEKIGVRVSDDEAEARSRFSGIKRFPVDPAYRVIGTLRPDTPQSSMTTQNILGDEVAFPTPGPVEFQLNGQQVALWPAQESPGDSLFFVVGDQTNGTDTYGGGRFLTADPPNDANEVVLDFNKAFNPPCAFTPYATCPLPSKQNVLDLEIEAGERVDAHPP